MCSSDLTGPVNTKVKVEGDITLNTDAQTTLDALVMDIDGSAGKYEVTFKMKKDGDKYKFEADVKKGTLSSNGRSLFVTLAHQLMAQLMALTADGELKIKIKKEA